MTFSRLPRAQIGNRLFRGGLAPPKKPCAWEAEKFGHFLVGVAGNVERREEKNNPKL